MQNLIDVITTYLQRVKTYNWGVVAVQLALIGFVVWLVMRFLRGTRGARLLKGAALLLGAVFLAIRLLPKTDDWRRIEYLYGRFLLFALIAFVVAFQPEIRRALISLGQARFFKGGKSESEQTLDQIIRSMNFLSRNKIGAILALERSVGLGAIADSGTQMDCKVTAEILDTIFYPGSALHDMGVIINQDRIVAAGCQFPMAESEEVDPSLGSRHRAALGLAQDCDAVVLVVSEETGRISIAYEGQLHIGLELEAVQEIVLQLIDPAQAKRRRAQRRIS